MTAPGRTRTFLTATEASESARCQRPLPPPSPRDHGIRQLPGAHIGIAGKPVEEPGLGFGVFFDEIEQRVGTGTPRLRSAAELRAQLAGSSGGPGRA